MVDLVSDDENENNQIPPPSKKPKVSSTLPLPLPKLPKFQNFGNSSGKNKLLSTTSKVCILKKSTQQPPKETPVVEDIDVDEAEPLVHIDSGKGPDEEPLDEGMYIVARFGTVLKMQKFTLTHFEYFIDFHPPKKIIREINLQFIDFCSF